MLAVDNHALASKLQLAVCVVSNLVVTKNNSPVTFPPPILINMQPPSSKVFGISTIYVILYMSCTIYKLWFFLSDVF